jgi:hypothetical protein
MTKEEAKRIVLQGIDDMSIDYTDDEQLEALKILVADDNKRIEQTSVGE